MGVSGRWTCLGDELSALLKNCCRGGTGFCKRMFAWMCSVSKWLREVSKGNTASLIETVLRNATCVATLSLTRLSPPRGWPPMCIVDVTPSLLFAFQLSIPVRIPVTIWISAHRYEEPRVSICCSLVAPPYQGVSGWWTWLESSLRFLKCLLLGRYVFLNEIGAWMFSVLKWLREVSNGRNQWWLVWVCPQKPLSGRCVFDCSLEWAYCLT